MKVELSKLYSFFHLFDPLSITQFHSTYSWIYLVSL